MLHIILSTQCLALIFGCCVLLAMSGGPSPTARRIAVVWFIFVPAAAALAMFSLILVSGRYVGPHLAVFGAGLLAAIKLPGAALMRKLLPRVAFAIVLLDCVALSTALPSYASLRSTGVSVFNAITGVEPKEVNPYYEVARSLEENGIRSGDKVAYIGESYAFYWARLAKAQVNAELRQFNVDGPPTSYASEFARARWRSDDFRYVDQYWKSEPLVQHAVLAAFAKAGSKAVVTDAIPIGQNANGWTRVSNTRYFVRLVSRP